MVDSQTISLMHAQKSRPRQKSALRFSATTKPSDITNDLLM